MAGEASVTGRRFTIAGVIDRMVIVISGQGWLLLGLAALFGGLPRFATFVMTMSAVKSAGLTGVRGAGALALFSMPNYWISVAISWLFGLLASASMTTVAVAAIERRPVSLGESIVRAMTKLLPLFLLSIVWALGVGLGFVLLLVPGIMLIIAWMVAWPAVIIEDAGPLDALGRSAYLTKGARWPIFAILLIVGVASAVVSGVTGTSSSAILRNAASSDLPILPMVVTVVLGTVVQLFSVALSSAMYTELRDWKDGSDGGELREIFA